MDESDFDDVLEPLPVYEDDVPVPPEPAVSTAVRELPPWSITDEERPPVRGRRSSATFTRMTDLDPDLLVDLPSWWRHRADHARVRVNRQLVLGAPKFETGGTWQLRGSLRSPWLRRWIPVELQMWPRLGAWTKVILEPERDVRAGRRYFNIGHRALDTLTVRLTSELHRH